MTMIMTREYRGRNRNRNRKRYVNTEQEALEIEIVESPPGPPEQWIYANRKATCRMSIKDLNLQEFIRFGISTRLHQPSSFVTDNSNNNGITAVITNTSTKDGTGTALALHRRGLFKFNVTNVQILWTQASTNRLDSTRLPWWLPCRILQVVEWTNDPLLRTTGNVRSFDGEGHRRKTNIALHYEPTGSHVWHSGSFAKWMRRDDR